MYLLLVEDEASLAEGLVGLFTARGHHLEWVSHGAMALQALQARRFDAVVLDLGLPDMSGMRVLAKLREQQADIPVLILSARNQSIDKVEAINAGADDYLSKPFDSAELEARLFALIRRRSGTASAKLQWAGVAFDANTKRFKSGACVISVSPREHNALLALVQAQGLPLSRQELLDRVFVADEDIPNDALDVVLYRLRKRLGDIGVAVRNVRGIGFFLEPQSHDSP
ncbi:MAG: DNA-binding response OmpR family regulator [Burkholderiaceae bacterium]|jgi:DNA-binding response OmpR family regulator